MQSMLMLALSTLLFAMILRLMFFKTIGLRFFRMGLVFDFLTLMGLFLLVTLIGPFFWFQKAFYSVFVIFFTLLTVVDRVYYRYFFTLTTRSNAQGLMVFKGDTNLTKEYNIRLGWQDVVIITFGIFTLIWLFIQTNADYIASGERFIGWLTFVGVLIIQLLLFACMRVLGHRKKNQLDDYQSARYLYKTMYDRAAYAESFGYYYYHLVDLFRKTPQINKPNALKLLEKRFDKHIEHLNNGETGKLKGSNVIHLTVESLDTRFINEHITPTLYKMMQSGYTFPNTYIPVFQQGATCNGEFMATTGLYAVNSNVHANNLCHKYRENQFPFSLPAQLKNAGYQTYYFHSGHGWFYHRKTLMPNMGFDTVKFQEDLKAQGHHDFCERFDTQMIHFLEHYLTSEKPFYLQMLTYGMHGAYNQKDYQHQNEKINKVYDETLDAELRVYLQKLAELDDFVSNIIKHLEKANVADKTLFVIAPDHYPYMLEQKMYTKHIGIEADSHHIHRQTLIMHHVKLSAKQFSKVGALVDVAPTVLNLVYPNGQFKYFDGEDLTMPGRGFAFLHDMSACDGLNRLYLNKPYLGDPNHHNALKQALLYHIQNYESQPLLFETDFFRFKR